MSFIYDSQKDDCLSEKQLFSEKTEEYVPSENEPFMCDAHVAFFRQKLLVWKNQLLAKAVERSQELLFENQLKKLSDEQEHAYLEAEQDMRVTIYNQEKKILSDIQEALARLDSGEFGYCSITGDPIELKRLIAYPIAKLCLFAQEKTEKQNKYKVVHAENSFYDIA